MRNKHKTKGILIFASLFFVIILPYFVYAQEGEDPLAGTNVGEVMNNNSTTPSGGSAQNSGSYYQNQELIPGQEKPTGDFLEYMQALINFGYAAIGILALFMLTIGAYQYLMAAGNIAKVDSAKETVSSALLGLAVGVLSWIILNTINPNLVGPSLKNINQFNSAGTGGAVTGGNYPIIAVNGSVKQKIETYQPYISAASAKYGVDENVIKAVIDQESSGNYAATSPKGAMGLMQLMPETASSLGVADAYNPEQNIMGGTKFLAGLINKYGLQGGLAYYNGGGNAAAAVMAGRPSNRETDKFVPSVMGKIPSYASPTKVKVM